MRGFGVRAILATASMFTCATAQSAVVLDQNALIAPSGSLSQPTTVVLESVGVNLTRNIAQIFTAGVTGTLDRIEAQIGVQPNSFGFMLAFLWEGNIFNGLGSGLPTTFVNSLPTIDSAFNQTGFAVADYSALNVQMTQGTEYTLMFAYVPFTQDSRAEAIIGQQVPGSASPVYNSYAGGETFINLSDGTSTVVSPGALGFRTYVNQTITAVPEPTTWAMMILGFGVVGSALRRQRRYRLSGTFG